MNFLPIHCQNCLSSKREFYIYMQCKHFLCLNCCLCLINIQNMTIRCCYRNTKMSQQLSSIVLQLVNKRMKLNDNEQIIVETQKERYQRKMHDQGQKLIKEYEKKQQQYENCIKNNLEVQKYLNKTAQKDEITMKTERQKKGSYKQNISQKKMGQKQAQENKKIKKWSQYQNFCSSEYPTFKQIKNINEKDRNKFLEQYANDFNDQAKISLGNNLSRRLDKQITNKTICWKNNNRLEDRILAKLNYQQQKINRVMQEHHYSS